MNINNKELINYLSVPTRLFIVIVVLPTLLSIVYYAILASDVYISEAKFSIRMSNETPTMGLVESFIGTTPGIESNSEDADIVTEYIRSRDMILMLDNSLQLIDHYSSSDIDFISRFDSDDSVEDFLDYYHEMIRINTNKSTNIITLQVRAFNPEIAQSVAQEIILLSEILVNNLSTRIIDDTLKFTRIEVKNAEYRLQRASEAMSKFRNLSSSINPDEETGAVLGIITGLEEQLAMARTMLLETQSYMQSESTQVKVLKSKVSALEKQIIEERKRLSSNTGSDTNFTHLINEYEPLVLEKELATQQYASSLASLEMARIDAQRKQRYLLSFVTPQSPDEAVEPDRLQSIITIFILLCVLYAIGALVWAAIKDHMRI